MHASRLTLWDVVEAQDDRDEAVVILHGQQVLWQELSFYENFRRFGEVATILRQKYGTNLTDLVPSRRSGLSLFGDALAAPDCVDAVRKRLRRGDRLASAMESKGEPAGPGQIRHPN